eukprot:6651873-Prymnesium_polylepis.1
MGGAERLSHLERIVAVRVEQQVERLNLGRSRAEAARGGLRQARTDWQATHGGGKRATKSQHDFFLRTRGRAPTPPRCPCLSQSVSRNVS